ncbi:ABC transporter ATP-binding protein [Haloferacaceae archaeon DSL9]
MAEIELAGVTKRYGDAAAVDDVSLSVDDGEFFTLVGPSGCGKTTTLRLIAGFEAPDEGTVRIGGEDATAVPPEDRGLGVVFQHYALFPHLSVAENVGYGLRFAEPPDGVSAEERVADLLELVGLAGTDDRDPDSLSGGQRQRVALARALAPGPRVLLLDEPMSALDARLRERLRRELRTIQSKLGVTTIYVTHDQEEALSVSDRVAVVNDGHLEQVSTPRSLYHRPRTRFVAEFVGDNNVFSGTIEQSNSQGSADETKGSVVRCGDERFLLRAGCTPAEIGERVTFCVRPERLSTDATTNRFRARVERAEFLGETTRVRLSWKGRTLTLKTNEPPERVVELGFDPADAHVLSQRR